MENIVFICRDMKHARYELKKFLEKCNPYYTKVDYRNQLISIDRVVNVYFIGYIQSEAFLTGRRNYIVRYI